MASLTYIGRASAGVQRAGDGTTQVDSVTSSKSLNAADVLGTGNIGLGFDEAIIAFCSNTGRLKVSSGLVFGRRHRKRVPKLSVEKVESKFWEAFRFVAWVNIRLLI